MWEGLQSETEYIINLLKNSDDENFNGKKVPDFDSRIFDTVDLKKQAERLAQQEISVHSAHSQILLTKSTVEQKETLLNKEESVAHLLIKN